MGITQSLRLIQVCLMKYHKVGKCSDGHRSKISLLGIIRTKYKSLGFTDFI